MVRDLCVGAGFGGGGLRTKYASCDDSCGDDGYPYPCGRSASYSCGDAIHHCDSGGPRYSNADADTGQYSDAHKYANDYAYANKHSYSYADTDSF